MFLKVLAEGGVPPEAVGGAGLIVQLMPIVVMIAVFYFVLIMPQRKRDKKTKEMIASLAVGDEIITIGGVYGKITAIKDETLTIESGGGVDKGKLKIAKWAVKECLTIRS